MRSKRSLLQHKHLTFQKNTKKVLTLVQLKLNHLTANLNVKDKHQPFKNTNTNKTTVSFKNGTTNVNNEILSIVTRKEQRFDYFLKFDI